MDDSPKTPRTGTPALPPPRPLPTLATVQTTVEVLVGQIKGLRLEVEALARAVSGPPPEVLRVSIPPDSAPALTPPARPSMAAKAAVGAGKVGQGLMIATGALTVIGQLATLWRPEYTGPIEQAIRLLRALGGGQP